MNIQRRKTRTCTVGNVKIGSDHPVAIQTMTMAKSEDAKAVIAEIKTIEDSACDIIRISIPTLDAAKNIPEIKASTEMPIVADIHFDPRLAIAALDYGADKIRINPGNFYDRSYLEKVIKLAKEKGAAIRIGVNAGSLEKDLWEKHGAPTADALAESALRWVDFVEALDFKNFVVSIKSERVQVMIAAYKKFVEADNDVPLHLGVTHAGSPIPGTVKNSMGIGALLMQGIGDTVRASITDSIEKEVEVCKNILKAIGLYDKEADVIACPTCGRLEVDLEKMLAEVEAALKPIKRPIRVAVMGCVVNAVGEAKESDYGIASGKKAGALFYKGELFKANVPEANLVNELLELIQEKEQIKL
ncbi:flavodoxin-dependent (E)-4-hydroxy-3-methylbut-2-enyl-diphosphate synthase [Candidatus Peregrinibacteria bacterium]|nr:flavodoxin-dependent (E)-4-hydroxy-3-methylbut-2-enyl-diphosphate synthase [Candidatus Peregrinibacteria bacterium]